MYIDMPIFMQLYPIMQIGQVRISRISRGFALRGLPNPRILWHSVTLPLNVARIWQSEPSTTRTPKEPQVTRQC